MCSAWNPLLAPSLDGNSQPLLIKYEFGPSYYSIWLTDLTHIWEETLDRKRIVQRAFAIDTSIDPSEDAGQMWLLLSSIKKALDAGFGTDIELSASDSGAQLSLKSSTPLPASLPPLRWNLFLQRCLQSMVTTKLVIPLLANHITAKAEETSLLQQLRDKDNIISKLINQMQAEGSDMSKVFPGTVSVRKSNKLNVRQVIGKSVKGVAEFDESLWRIRLSQETSVPTDLRELLSKASPIDAAEASQSIFIPDVDAWWDQGGQDKRIERQTVSSRKESPRDEDLVGMKVEDDFQVGPSHSAMTLPIARER